MTVAPDIPGSEHEDAQSRGGRPESFKGYPERYIVPILLGILVTAFLYLVSQYNFALYHTTVEFTTIAISLAIFLLVWNSRKIIDNNYLIFIGVTFVFIAILDFLHTLVYQGVGIFPDSGGALSTRFWIAARYMQAITLLAAPLFIRRNLRLDLVAIVYLLADIIIVASIFIFNIFPATYIGGIGLTPFKIVSEYVISLILIVAIVILYRNRASFDGQVLNNLIIAIFLTIAAEFTFTEYASFTDIFSLLGHVFRLVSYYFFYRAIIEVGQKKPYNLLYRNLTESEKKYRALSDLSPDAILVVQDGIIRYANESGLRMSGVPSLEKLVGRKLQDFVHGDDQEFSTTRIEAVQNDQEIAPLRELRINVGGGIIPVEATGGPITWVGKNAVQVVIRDITQRKQAADELVLKNRLLNSANEDLNRLNRELIAAHLALQQNLEALTLREEELSKALAEKEVLLSEVHHRVKNNLTAFISLLSLEGSTEDTPAGKILKQDLQNRARSMALIHETLYRTHSYNEVDMGIYLETLLEQIACSLSTTRPVKTIIHAHGVMLDIPRATPAGLIINELVTNSFKYAFPDSFNSPVLENDPHAITIALTRNAGEYLLTVQDNGVGLPPGFDITKTKTLGLKLVNFLAKHQLQAKVEVASRNGTEFAFRFKE